MTQGESKLEQGRGDEQPSWSQSFLSDGHGDSQFDSQLQRKSQQEANAALSLDFAEPELQMFDYISQVQHCCSAWGGVGQSDSLQARSVSMSILEPHPEEVYAATAPQLGLRVCANLFANSNSSTIRGLRLTCTHTIDGLHCGSGLYFGGYVSRLTQGKCACRMRRTFRLPGRRSFRHCSP